MAEPPMPHTTSAAGSAGGIAGYVPKNAPARRRLACCVALAQLSREPGDLAEHAGGVDIGHLRRPEAGHVACVHVAHLSPPGSPRGRGRASPP